MATAEYWKRKYEREAATSRAYLSESAKWKAKYLKEKERRRVIAQKLLEAIKVDSKRTSISNISSTTSDKDETNSILSPTLKSFDFDFSEESDDELSASSEPLVPSSLPFFKRRGMSDRVVNDKTSLDSVDNSSSSRSRSYTMENPPLLESGSSLSSLASSNSSRTSNNNMLIKMLWNPTISGKDLWSNKPNKRHLSSVAKAILLTCCKRHQPIFDTFFITGINPNEMEKKIGLDSPETFQGYWKPQILYQYPLNSNSKSNINQSSIGEFCFPLGVPISAFDLVQSQAMQGHLVSSWSIDPSSICEEHLSDAFDSQCYSFKLTGIRGENLYGFCATVMEELFDASSLFSQNQNQNQLMQIYYPSRQIHMDSEDMDDLDKNTSSTRRSFSFFSSSHHLKHKKKSKTNTEQTILMAPRSYCFTSKYPFYKLYFHMLRNIIEKDMKERMQKRMNEKIQSTNQLTHFEEYEVVVSTHGSLDLILKGIEDSPSLHHTLESSSSTSFLNMVALSSISPYDNTKENELICETNNTLYENNKSISSNRIRTRSNSWSKTSMKELDEHDVLHSSFSFNKPVMMVEGFLHNQKTQEWHQHVEIGDYLVQVNGIRTNLFSFKENIEMIRSMKRPLHLKFTRRIQSSSLSSSMENQQDLFINIEKLLENFHKMKVKEPGQRSSTLVSLNPLKECTYQFPKENPMKWTCGVLFRYLSSQSILQLVCFLLLERKIVICSQNTALLSAITNALILLLEPFEWQVTFIPILPSTLLDILHSPVPYLIGSPVLVTKEEWPDVCFLDVDQQTLEIPCNKDYNLYPNALPNQEILLKQITNASYNLQALHDRSKPWHFISQKEMIIIDQTLKNLQTSLKSICGNVEKYCIPNKESERMEVQFIEEKFLSETKSMNEEFVFEFLATQMFLQYCEQMMKSPIF